MPRDNYPGQGAGVSTPSPKFRTITPNSSADLAEIPKFLYVGTTAGTVVAVDEDGNESSFYAAAGQKLEIRPTRILETSGASPIIGVY